MLVREEYVREAYQELDDLLHDYFRRSVASEDIPPLDMNWRAYMQLSNSGNLKLYTARQDNLVGFVMYHIHPHLHHVGTTNAACDILAVHYDARGHGIGRALLEYAEPKLKELGVQYVTHQFRTCYKDEPLFPKLGYRLIEMGYLKDIS